MHILERTRGTKIEVEVQGIKNSELRTIKKSKGFIFDWEDLPHGEIYKLIVKGSGEIIGLMNIVSRTEPGFECIEVIAIEKRMQQEDKPDYQNVAGCLFAFAARESFRLNLDGYLFLIAKTKSAEIFHDKYGFEYLSNKNAIGIRMSSDSKNSYKLIKTFLDS